MKTLSVLYIFIICMSCQSDWESKVIKEVSALEEILVETSKSGDLDRQLSLFSDQYSYIDINGNLVDKQTMASRRTDDKMFAATLETADLEVIPLTRDFAISRGRYNTKNIYHGGIPKFGSSRYMAVWRKENGVWRLFRDQVTNLVDRASKKPKLDRAEYPNNYGLGDYKLQNEYGVTIRIDENNDSLSMNIPGQLEKDYVLYPTYDNTWFIEEERWTLQFSESGDSLKFNSWGVETLAIRTNN